MGFWAFLWTAMIGAVAGWLAARMVAGGSFGMIGNIVVGVVGAFIAQILFPRIGLGFGGGLISELVRATFGAVILLVVIRIVKRA